MSVSGAVLARPFLAAEVEASAARKREGTT
jgi:hypothetical protein